MARIDLTDPNNSVPVAISNMKYLFIFSLMVFPQSQGFLKSLISLCFQPNKSKVIKLWLSLTIFLFLGKLLNNINVQLRTQPFSSISWEISILPYPQHLVHIFCFEFQRHDSEVDLGQTGESEATYQSDNVNKESKTKRNCQSIKHIWSSLAK